LRNGSRRRRRIIVYVAAWELRLALTIQQMRGTNGTPFKAGFDTLTAGNQIPAASTGRRGSHLSTKPIPVPPPRKVPYENTQAGPSEPRLDSRIIAGSRKKLNLNPIEAKPSEDDWVIQGDPGELPDQSNVAADRCRSRRSLGWLSSDYGRWPIQPPSIPSIH
jgi:hypothetical protein